MFGPSAFYAPGATQVSERLGCVSVGITLDPYSHVIPALQEEVTEKIDAGLRATPTGWGRDPRVRIWRSGDARQLTVVRANLS
jgi:hypothetical protein